MGYLDKQDITIMIEKALDKYSTETMNIRADLGAMITVANYTTVRALMELRDRINFLTEKEETFIEIDKSNKWLENLPFMDFKKDSDYVMEFADNTRQLVTYNGECFINSKGNPIIEDFTRIFEVPEV